MYLPFSSNDVAPINLSDAVLSSTGGSTWLSSWWTAGAVTAVCLLVAVFLLLFHRPLSRKRPGRNGQPKSRNRFWAGIVARIAGVLVLVLVAGAFLANAYVGYVPNLTAGGRVLAAATGQGSDAGAPGTVAVGGPGTVGSVGMPGDTKLRVAASDAWVYTPPGYDASGKTRYPVLYLIHGYPGTAADWFAAAQIDQTMDALIAQNMVKPMIVVSLDVNGGGQRDTECLDAINGPKIESWIYTQAIPFIDKTYPTRTDRSGRILGGMSSGGYCSLDQGLRHQDTWSTIISFEGYGDPGSGGKSAFNGNQALIKAHSPSDYLPTMKFTHPQAFYLDNGDRSGVARVKKLADQLKSRQQKVYYRINAGQGHTWSEVRAGLPYALVFASRELPGK
ncbi:alpha/beta hydrolase [Paeniglutamicibacter antarcticus]|uniref:Alpha/beta hydrolase-fold protein n=1 Tax=Paeniglutamicibacter antarcticus TaxID=494023 RepID=A0ABP9TIT0_9MICC